MKFLPVRFRMENKSGEIEELDLRDIFSCLARIMKCNSLNWDKNQNILTQDKRMMTIQYQLSDELNFLKSGIFKNGFTSSELNSMPPDKIYKI